MMQMCLQNVKNKLNLLFFHALLQYLFPLAATPGALWALNECLLIYVSHCLIIEHNDIKTIINITIVMNENFLLKNKSFRNMSVQRSRLNDPSKI